MCVKIPKPVNKARKTYLKRNFGPAAIDIIEEAEEILEPEIKEIKSA